MKKETKNLLNDPDIGIKLSAHESRQIEVAYDKYGDVLFTLKALKGLPCCRVRLKRLSEKETAFRRDRFKKGSKQKMIIGGEQRNVNLNILRFYQKGLLEGKMSPAEIALAGRGILPKGWGFHHWHAIALNGNPLDENNLILIENSAHKLAHFIMDSLLNHIPENNDRGREFYLDLPDLSSVVTNEMLGQMLKKAKAIQQGKGASAQLHEAPNPRRVMTSGQRNGVIRQRFQRGLGWYTITKE